MTDPAPIPASRSAIRRVAVVTINLLLVAIIVGVIVATWLPALLDRNPIPQTPGRRALPME